MKLFTPVDIPKGKVSLLYSDRIMVLGSCFADSVGTLMQDAGLDVMVNPFGTLYNPASLLSAIKRLDSGKEFTADDCVEMGAGAEMICSFSHHTSFARPGREEFLENANEALRKASTFWKACGKAVITLGTARCWRHTDSGIIVSNCLKRPAGEFTRELMSVQQVRECLEGMVSGGREFIFTVSPIRHPGDGAHGNTVSKATLHLALAAFLEGRDGCDYFPSYEIMIDELRDYRFYAEDLLHPSAQAIRYIWESFCESVMSPPDVLRVKEEEKKRRGAAHRPLLRR